MSIGQLDLPLFSYQKIVSYCPLGIALTRLSDSVFCEANAAFCDLIGYSREEVIGHSAHELHHWNNMRERDYLLSQIKQRRDVGEITVEIRRKSGAVIKAKVSFSFIELAGEAYLLGFMTDIHDFELARNEQLKLEQSLYLLKKATGIGIWEWEETNGLLSWSPELEKMYGIQQQTFSGSYADWLQLIHSDDLPYVENCIAAAIADRASFDFNFRILRPDGSVRWLQSLGNTEYKEDGALLRSIGINIDITELKLHEHELRLTAEIMANMAEGVVIVNALSGEIVFANRKCNELLGYDQDELLGHHVSILNSPTADDPAEAFRLISTELNRTGVWRGEVRNRRKDGEDIWCRWSVSTFNHPDHGTVWLGVNGNINAEKTAQLERDLSHEALRRLSSHIRDEIEAERSALAHDIHDQLASNLTGIRMRLEALARGLPLGISDVARTELMAIAQLTSSLQKSTREICSRLHPAVLEDLGLVEACRWLLRDWIESTGIQVSENFEPLSLPKKANINIDVFRTLQELLTNVARHAQATGVEVCLFERGQDVCLCVADDGLGFDARANTEGFGLAGVRERARRHRGQVDIKSDETGSMIAVTFVRGDV